MPSRDDERAQTLGRALTSHDAEVAASRVYLALLRAARPSRELLIAQGIPAAVVDPALTLLAGRGLVRLGADGAVEVPPPTTTIPHHASELERRAAELRATAYDLTQVFYNARATERTPDSGIVLLGDLDEVATQSSALVAGAVEQVSVARAMTGRSEQLLRAPLESHREPTVGRDSRPVRYRTVWDGAVLERPGAVDVLRARRAGGEEQRFFPRVPCTVLLVDRSACLVEWTIMRDDDDGPVGIVLHTSGLVRAVLQFFDRLWELATPVDRGTVADDIDRRDLTILRLLAAGVADAAIARQTGVSQRTVERRIRSLSDRLGAGTRFQAGVQAVRRGWL